jgi:hypothetical protein
MRYVEGGERAAVRRPCEPFHAQVVGLATRQRGYYSKGSGVAASFYTEFDFVEASLSVTGTLKVWLVRGGMMNKELEVADDDLEPTMGQERAPNPIADGEGFHGVSTGSGGSGAPVCSSTHSGSIHGPTRTRAPIMLK